MRRQCRVGITPLTDMESGSTYQGFPGGLYPDGNSPPDFFVNNEFARPWFVADDIFVNGFEAQ